MNRHPYARLWTGLFIIFAFSAVGCATLQTPRGPSGIDSYEQALVGRHYPEANRLLGPHLPVLRDAESADRFLRYPAPELNGERGFFLVRVSPRDVVLAVSRWRETHVASGKELTIVAPATSDALAEPNPAALAERVVLRLHDPASDTARWFVYAAEGDFWGRRRVLLVEQGADGAGESLRCFAVEGAFSPRAAVGAGAPVPRPTHAAKISLFDEP